MLDLKVEEVREQTSIFDVINEEAGEMAYIDIRPHVSLFADHEPILKKEGESDESNETKPAEEPASFWQRQFQQEPTRKQLRYDWLFGVIMPVICFALDPFVFKGSGDGDQFLSTAKVFAYLLSFVSILG